MTRLDELGRTKELFQLLQGDIPEGIHLEHKDVPQLTPDQAWTVIWYLGNQYWTVPDTINRCDMCGALYHSSIEGACLDYGDEPHFFCESCTGSETFRGCWNRRHIA